MSTAPIALIHMASRACHDNAIPWEQMSMLTDLINHLDGQTHSIQYSMTNSSTCCLAKNALSRTRLQTFKKCLYEHMHTQHMQLTVKGAHSNDVVESVIAIAR
jgi:hypothetical protein